MKDRIIERLESHIDKLIQKDELSPEEVQFLNYWLGRIEMQEKEEESKRLANENNLRWQEGMKSMLDTLNTGGVK